MTWQLLQVPVLDGQHVSRSCPCHEIKTGASYVQDAWEWPESSNLASLKKHGWIPITYCNQDMTGARSCHARVPLWFFPHFDLHRPSRTWHRCAAGQDSNMNACNPYRLIVRWCHPSQFLGLASISSFGIIMIWIDMIWWCMIWHDYIYPVV